MLETQGVRKSFVSADVSVMGSLCASRYYCSVVGPFQCGPTAIISRNCTDCFMFVMGVQRAFSEVEAEF